MNLLNIELLSYWAALTGYSVATAVAVFGVVLRKRPERFLLGLMSVSWLLHTVAIATRWERLGHAPFVNIFEMLSANVWGLMAAIIIGYWTLPKIRSFVAITLPIVMLIMAWMLIVPKEESMLPPTFYTVWLVIHIGFIKLFMGSAFVALGIAGIVLLRRVDSLKSRFDRLPTDAVIDNTAYRCMTLALIFDTLGVAAGAIWAQDAWGRYWSWDPLEVWSLATWLSIGLMLHVRASFKTSPAVNAMLIVGVFMLSFFTFFGIPFVSVVLHKGLL